MTQPPYPDPSQTQLPNPNPNRQPIQQPAPTPAVQPAPAAYPPSIDPNASAPPAAPAPAAPTASAGPAQATTIGAPQGPGGQYTAAQILAPFDTEYSQASQAVLDLNDRINGRHGIPGQPDITGSAETLAAAQANAIANPAGVNSATSQYQADLTAYSAAQSRLYSANAARATALQTAIEKDQLVPGQVAVAQAQVKQYTAAAEKLDAEKEVLQNGADSQRNLTIAQTALATNQGLLEQANARAVELKAGPEADQARAQAATLNAQANSINALVDANKRKLNADATLTEHQVGLTDTQSDLYKAQAAEADARTDYTKAQADYQRSLIPGAPGLQAAQTAAAAGQGAQAQAAAQQTLADIQAKKLGPAYGLQDQIDAIQSVVQNVFHNPANAGKSPDELKGMADDLLKQYTTAAIGGTTPYAASVAAANYQQNQNATQMSGVNAMQAAMANRANAYAGLGGSVLGQLGQMNQYAPKGTTTGAAAFQQVMDQMAQRLAAPQFAPVNLPQPSPLPPFLQAFAAGHQAGQQQANAQPQAGGQQAPTVNINVNGQPQGGAPANATPSPVITPPATLANSTNAAFANGLAQGAGSPVPAFANNYMAFAQPMNMIGYRGVF